jgi:hypothetical protein
MIAGTSTDAVLIAARNSFFTISNVTFSLTGLDPSVTTATVVGEERTVSVANGTLIDSFGSYDAHVYRFISKPQVSATVTLTQTEAIGISSGQPGSSYGDCRVGYNSSNGDGVAISFYKFTLPTIANAKITSMTFDYAACGWRPDGQSGPLRSYAKYISNDSWTTSTTWSTAPVTDYWAITGVGQSPEWTNYAYTGWSWSPDPDPIDVTGEVTAAEGTALNGQVVSFAGMVTGGWTPWACDGYEARYDSAALTVEYTLVPEPMTALLCLGGLVGLRRKLS